MAKRRPMKELRAEYAKLNTQIRRLWKRRDGIGGQIARRTIGIKTGDLVALREGVDSWGQVQRKARYRVLAVSSGHDQWGDGRHPEIRIHRVKGRVAELDGRGRPFTWRASDFEKKV